MDNYKKNNMHASTKAYNNHVHRNTCKHIIEATN